MCPTPRSCHGIERRRGIEHRADDDAAALATRLKAYREQTAPVLDWFRTKGTVHVIPAVGDITAIADRVKGLLGR